MTKTNNYPSKAALENQLKTEEPRIVAVGASAGGLEALKLFFESIPETDKNAYVVIQHLSPDYKSMMGELLKKNTNLPILEITENTKIKQGHIYLIPPVNNLLLENGRFKLVDKPKDQSLNLPIDMFFESLAKFNQNQAIGVILSGTGSDGTRGVRAIKENDGMIMVQEPEEAKFDGMPQSAINTGLVDYVIPVDEMAGELKNFIDAPAVFHFKDGDLNYDESQLMQILRFIDERTGLDFREYKHATLARRIARRMNVCKCKDLTHYFETLKNNKAEVDILHREFLIGVTKFFRDKDVWNILKNKVIPAMVDKKKNGDVLKVWDVACSSGEEAYSFAMLINEEIERQQKSVDLKIFATDISQKHLDIGSEATYPESIVADIDADLLLKYFYSRPNGYKVVDKLRRMVVFSRHNIIKNPPFSNMDMVVCRNLLIYFQPAIQNKSLNFLHYALKKEGILVLGTSENVGSQKDNFKPIDLATKIYKNVNPNKRLNSKLTRTQDLGVSAEIRKPEKTISKKSKNPIELKLKEELNSTILQTFGGASVFVDHTFNILQAVGEFRKYANLPVNGFSINLLEMLAPDLKYVVQSTLNKARKSNEQLRYEDANFEINGEQRAVDILVKPYQQKIDEGDPNFIITFIEKDVSIDDVKTVDKLSLSNRTKEYVSELEEELRETKEELNTSLEEIETSNEELQAANEELLASNEELQSTNEELQSVNEEINTVNAENLQKVEDLAALNADMNNMLESTEMGVIFLDKELCIRKFTPATQRHFNLISTDEGRPIEHFISSMGRQNLITRCKRVLRTGKILEKQVKAKEGAYFLRRISPYIDSNGEINGVVITFIDVGLLQRSKEKLIASEKRFKSFYEEDPVLHISVDSQSSLIMQCNQTAVTKLGYETKEELIDKPIFDLYNEESQIRALKSNKEFKATGQVTNMEQDMLTASGDLLPVILNATAERDEEGKIVNIRYTCVDISEIKQAEMKLMQQHDDLERANKDLEQFVSICSHDLQEPLSTIKFGSDVLGKMYGDKLDQKGKDYIQYIKTASTRLSDQIKALLEHSRIGRNGQKSLVNIQEVIEVVKYDLGKRIKDTKAKIYAGSMPKINGHEVELRLLFQNLISNAIKYTPKEKTPEIRISSYKEGNYWVFAIMDNGMGISKEDQKNIFTIFNRVRNEEENEGTGVGLAHVEKIVLLHEGSIWLDSQPGVGSTFYFKLKA
ncbi:two-component system, chemotaxis family, CheB/CheR fusion protein [Salegentibacter echinorum]|uniref:Two-component system, chemotaxis family, CheB/CheR fusion protein n=1 Tax=Salegentibacter echinorum TaxID=1073325 RepID=A0A1M5FLB2_SALEC|nr:CheR family methyltransferase [Salegentibacter echinorum]SHF92275.1 two-component system, chemotaxis family, CheB/CheR fusion protein [Salegentibacter echinorum]